MDIKVKPNYRGGKFVNCEVCNKPHYRIPARLKKIVHYYCSRKCHSIGRTGMEFNKKGRILKCTVCNKEYYSMNCHLRQSKFCSNDCYNEYQKNRVKLKCDACGAEYERPLSQTGKSKHKYCSKKCHAKGSSMFMVGENSTSWKGGISINNKTIRKRYEWKQWRKEVFERDNYTCQICGSRSKKGNPVELHPHHIKSYSKFPEVRYDVDNGKTLCAACHYKLHGQLSKGTNIIMNIERIDKLCPGCNEIYKAKKNQLYCSHKCNERIRRKNAKTHK